MVTSLATPQLEGYLVHSNMSKEIAKKYNKPISTSLTSNIVYNTMFHHIQYHYY